MAIRNGEKQIRTVYCCMEDSFSTCETGTKHQKHKKNKRALAYNVYSISLSRRLKQHRNTLLSPKVSLIYSESKIRCFYQDTPRQQTSRPFCCFCMILPIYTKKAHILHYCSLLLILLVHTTDLPGSHQYKKQLKQPPMLDFCESCHCKAWINSQST